MWNPDEDDEREDEDDAETGDDEGGDDKPADSTDDKPKSEDQAEDDDAQPREGDEPSEESEEDEEPEDGAPDPEILAKLKEILDDRDEGLDERVREGVRAAREAEVAEAAAEEEAKKAQELFTRAEEGDEEALAELGQLTLKRFQQARVEEPIVKRARQEAAAQFDSEYREGMDILLEEFGLADTAKALTEEERAALNPQKFRNKSDWTRAVARAVASKAKGGSTDESEKAKRRSKTAQRARAGGRTLNAPRGQSGDEAEAHGQSARDWILSGEK